MKVTLPNDSAPRFSREQLDYLKKRFEFKLTTGAYESLEPIHIAQGQLMVLNHIEKLIDSQ